MTAYEKIKYLLEMGVYKGVEVELSSGGKITITSFTDGSEGGHISDGYGNGWVKNVVLNRNITSITPIPNPQKLLPVGTKVRVFEEFEDLQGEYVIDGTDGMGGYMLTKKDGLYPCPHRAVYPVWED